MSVIFTKPAAGIKTDYLDASDINNDSTVSGATVKDALEAIDNLQQDYINTSEMTTISGDIVEQIHIESVEEFTLDATDISNKYVEMYYTPIANNEVLVWVERGIKGLYDTDYTVNGTQLSWGALDWDGVLEVNDILTILYWH